MWMGWGWRGVCSGACVRVVVCVCGGCLWRQILVGRAWVWVFVSREIGSCGFGFLVAVVGSRPFRHFQICYGGVNGGSGVGGRGCRPRRCAKVAGGGVRLKGWKSGVCWENRVVRIAPAGRTRGSEG